MDFTCKTAFLTLALVLAHLFVLTHQRNLRNSIEQFPDEEVNTDVSGTHANANLHRCGGVYRTPNVTIHYKPFEKILPNERCVWIIASTNGSNVASSYRVTTNSAGFLAYENRLLSYAALQKNTETLRQSYPSGVGYSDTITGRVLIVTFYTKNTTREYNGFVLTIVASQFGTGVNPSSRYEILDPDSYFHSHPATSGAYFNNELTALIYPPISQGLQGFRNQVIGLKERSLEEFFADWIGIHFYDINTSTWKYKGRITGGFKLEKVMHNDLILLVFDSNQDYAFLGFELTSMTT